MKSPPPKKKKKKKGGEKITNCVCGIFIWQQHLISGQSAFWGLVWPPATCTSCMYELWGHKFGLLWPTSGCAGTYLASCWSHLAPHKVVLGHILPYVAQHNVVLEQTWPFSALIIPGCGKLRGILTLCTATRMKWRSNYWF